MNTTKTKIQALWFDSKGCGPDLFDLQLQPMKTLMDGEHVVAPASLGLRVRAGDLVILGHRMIDGGFNLHRDQVEELHRQIGAWLEDTMTVSEYTAKGAPTQRADLVAEARQRKEWDQKAHDEGRTSESDGYESSDYVDGWNDALDAIAEPLADQLEAVTRSHGLAPVIQNIQATEIPVQKAEITYHYKLSLPQGAELRSDPIHRTATAAPTDAVTPPRYDRADEFVNTPDLIPVQKNENSITYHLAGILVDGGQTRSVLAVSANIDPSPHFPDSARIVVGAPEQSPLMEGGIPRTTGGFAMDLETAEGLVSTVQQAINDVRRSGA